MINWTPERWRRASDLLDAALQVPPAEQTAFLESACDDEVLRREVEAMLDLDVQGCTLLDGNAADVAAPLLTAPFPEGNGETRIGRYRLLEPLGRGGMGIVYLAERADGQYHQHVALKLLTRASPDAFRRFQAERQILASLDHAGVARLLDGGTAPPTPSQPDGVPYLVMEHVDGEPITDYCERKELSIDARVDLMIDVASAVQHAHQKMVVHRDLKPSNIYVTDDGDGQPQVKLLDFGIAKMLDRDALAPAVDLVSTQTGLAILTPAYAAPEQVAGQPCDATTDVYQLGVVLYELLTGCLPFSFEGASLSEVTRIILEQEPPRPSAETRSRTSCQTAPPGRATWGDLDTIILKAMRKESDRRYASVATFREDLARYQQKQPIRARPSTTMYRAQKFVQRYRMGVSTAVVMIGVILAFLIVLAQQRNEARVEAEKARQVSGYLTELFQSSRPDIAQGETITASMLLDEGERRLHHLDDEPAVQAQMLLTIGQARLSLGQLQTADSLLTLAAAMSDGEFGPQDERTLMAQIDLANAWHDSGQYDAADSLLHHVLLKSRRAGNDTYTAAALNDLGNVAEKQSRYAEAEAYHREALILRRRLFENESKEIAASLNNIGRALHSQDRLEPAERYYRDAAALNRTVHGLMHPETSITLRNLAELLQTQARYDEADSLLQEVLRIDRAVMPEGHPRIAEDLNDLGTLATKRGHYTDAETHFRKALQIQRRQLGDMHPRIALSYNNLAYVLEKLDQTDSVLVMRQRAVAVALESLGPDHVRTGVYIHNVGKSLYDAGRLAEAERRFRNALAIMKSRLPENHRMLTYPLFELGSLCMDTGRAAEAEPLLRAGLTIARSTWSPDHPRIAEVESMLGHSLVQQGELERGEALLEKGYARLREVRGEEHTSTQTARRYLEEARGRQVRVRRSNTSSVSSSGPPSVN